MKPFLLATLLAATLAAPAAAFISIPFPMIFVPSDFPPDGAFDTQVDKNRPSK